MRMNIVKILAFVVLFLLLFGCSKKEESHSFKVSDEVGTITVSGAGTSLFFQDQDERDIVLKDSSDIKTFVDGIQNAEYFQSGDMTTEGPNLNFTLSYKDGTHDSFDLWLAPGNPKGRFQAESGELYILKNEDIQTLIDLLGKNAEAE